jgi:hypothetical protein
MARKYRKIDPRIWGDERFVSMSEEEKLVALYCLTCPQGNRIGFFRFSIPAAAEDIGTSPVTLAKRFGNVCRTLKWTFDERSKVLYFPTWWKYNAPDNPNGIASCLEDLHDVPATQLLASFCGNTKYLKPTLAQRFRNVTGNVTHNVSPQEQEQEQEQEQDIKPQAAKRFSPPTVAEVAAYCTERGNGIDPEAFVASYQSKGWKVGKTPMSDWKAAVVTWEKNNGLFNAQPKPSRVNSGNTHDPEAARKDPNYGRL